MEAEAPAELVKPAQVLDDGDPGGQQRGVHRARWAAGVIDVDRVDADQCGLLLGQPAAAAAVRKGFAVP